MRSIIYAILWALFTFFVCYYIYTQQQNAAAIAQEVVSNTEEQVEIINEVDGSSYLTSDDNSTADDNTSENISTIGNENSDDVSTANQEDTSTNDDDGKSDMSTESSEESSTTSTKMVKDYAKNFIEKAYIEFGQNSTKLPKDDQFDTYLDSVANLLAEGNHQVIVVGHADSATSRKQNNYQIGLRRAEFIKGMLTSKGVAGNMITVLSEGDESPRVLGDTKEAKTLNRRVELFIKQKN